MSSILKALKKLEDEKAARSGKAADIAGAILKTGRRKGEKQRWLIPSGMLAVAVIAVLATYAVMGGFSSRRQETTPATERISPQPQPVAPTPIAVAPPRPSGVEPRLQRTLPKAAKNSILRVTQTSTPRTPAVKEEPRSVISTPQQATATVEKRPEALPPVAIPVLKVSGIAWQKDGASRLAVVNGTSVAEGATVGGARVDQIFPDRVRFTFENRTVEIPLGKTSGDK